MIVLFTGAGGTGKTTLARLTAERYGEHYLASTSREVQAEYGIFAEDDQLALSRERLAEVQRAIAGRYWITAVGATAKGGYVADRTLADHYCYAMMKQWDTLTQEELDWYESRVQVQFNEADLVVYCPTGYFAPPSDGMRTDSQAQREVFDRLLRGVIDRARHYINLLPMTVGPLESRQQHLHTALLNVGAVQPADDKEARLVR